MCTVVTLGLAAHSSHFHHQSHTHDPLACGGAFLAQQEELQAAKSRAESLERVVERLQVCAVAGVRCAAFRGGAQLLGQARLRLH